MRQCRLTIVVPCYNEEAVLPRSAQVLLGILRAEIKRNRVNADSRLLLVDDGSTDTTWSIIRRLESESVLVNGLKFSRNFGHQNALMAGLTTAHATSDAIITIDADLQDDPQLISQMVTAFLGGADVVLGVRNNRASDTWFKRQTAMWFYRLMNKMGVELVPNHADYRLLSQRAVTALLANDERCLFLRGMIPRLGFTPQKLFYVRQPRLAGKSKYTLGKMLNLALNGLISFSLTPLHLLFFLGVLTVGISFLGGMGTLILGLLRGSIANWQIILPIMGLLSGGQLMGMGILGEYLGKTLMEVKHRPRYIIEQNDYRTVGRSVTGEQRLFTVKRKVQP